MRHLYVISPIARIDWHGIGISCPTNGFVHDMLFRGWWSDCVQFWTDDGLPVLRLRRDQWVPW